MDASDDVFGRDGGADFEAGGLLVVWMLLLLVDLVLKDWDTVSAYFLGLVSHVYFVMQYDKFGLIQI